MIEFKKINACIASIDLRRLN